MRSAALLCLLLAGCGLRPRDLPEERPALADMEEPLELFEEPADEAARRALLQGGFTGAYVGDARDSLDALLGEAEGLRVQRVVENSPADAAGIVAGDLLLEARLGDEPPRPLAYPSEWRELELASRPGDRITVLVDRAGRRSTAAIDVEARLHPPERAEGDRLREEARVGVVLRTATEVEARSAGLAPGGGAVIVGLSRQSPWRAAGLGFGDLLVEIDGKTVAHPEVVLDAIRSTEADELHLVWVRDGERRETRAELSGRERRLRELYVPLVVSRETVRDKTTTSVLLGIYKSEVTPAASRYRILWFVRFGRGDTDRLLEVDG